MFSKTLRRHMLADRSSKKKRQARRGGSVHETQIKAIRLRLPY